MDDDDPTMTMTMMLMMMMAGWLVSPHWFRETCERKVPGVLENLNFLSKFFIRHFSLQNSIATGTLRMPESTENFRQQTNLLKFCIKLSRFQSVLFFLNTMSPPKQLSCKECVMTTTGSSLEACRGHPAHSTSCRQWLEGVGAGCEFCVAHAQNALLL